MTSAVKERAGMEHKIISISSKRQITIPQRYYDTLGFDNEAECVMMDGGIFIRPVKLAGSEFAEQILSELISKGYSGDVLLSRFKEKNRQIRPAVEKLIEEADDIAESGESIEVDRLFD